MDALALAFPLRELVIAWATHVQLMVASQMNGFRLARRAGINNEA